MKFLDFDLEPTLELDELFFNNTHKDIKISLFLENINYNIYSILFDFHKQNKLIFQKVIFFEGLSAFIDIDILELLLKNIPDEALNICNEYFHKYIILL